MHGIAFQLFGFNIHWYGIMVALGFLASLAVLQYKRNYARMTSDQVIDLSIIVVVCGILGARIAYVIQFFDQFRGDFWKIFRIDQGGLVFYGGFILAALVIFRYVRKHKLCVSRILDICAPAMAIGHAFGRVGCFIQGCCFGIPCKSFGVVYPPGTAPAARYPDVNSVFLNLQTSGKAAASSLPLLPVQLLESAGNLLLGIGLLLLFRRIRKSGTIAAAYFIGYGILRFVLECFRGDHTDRIIGLTRAQLVGLFIMIPIGIFCYLYFRKHGEDVNTEPTA
ncbi:MAG: prolipoprotein diacylglyceryl transferase [Lentisphaeria bacterium]|nr:prolipoprotein diacylglyceryl transferase [Lentisphaeria bacterium]